MPTEARAYPRPLPNPEWLGKLTEEILEPDLPIVDPHHHLWDHPDSRYLLDELLADVNSGHNIVATVFIQCGSGYRTSGPEEMRPIGESEFVRAIAEEGDRRGGKTKICAGVVSFADLRLPNVDAVLEGQIAAAGGRFRGIRHIAAHDPGQVVALKASDLARIMTAMGDIASSEFAAPPPQRLVRSRHSPAVTRQAPGSVGDHPRAEG
jgi:L-fuconolactonase